jgi:dipeptidyl aminopeptidase/acylaminoacyl peptidase
MFTYDFKLTTDDKNVGTVYLPSESATNFPVLIYCHGWGSSRFDNAGKLRLPSLQLCDRAVKENMAFVVFDFFGCGETGGDYRDFTYSRWKNNLDDVISWVESQSFADKSKIACYGTSSGSTAVLRLVAEDNRICAAISNASCITHHFAMNEGGPAKRFAENVGTLANGGTFMSVGIDFGLDFYVDTITKAPMHTMDKIKCPVLFLQGQEDGIYRRLDAQLGYDLMIKSDCDKRTSYMPIEGGNHDIDNMPEVATERVFEWLLPILREGVK